jgi:hypothetical protein
MVGEVEGYLWMRRRAAAVDGCDKRGGGGGGGWGSNAEAEMVCHVSLESTLLGELGEASKNWEVGRKSVGSR